MSLKRKLRYQLMALLLCVTLSTSTFCKTGVVAFADGDVASGSNASMVEPEEESSVEETAQAETEETTEVETEEESSVEETLEAETEETLEAETEGATTQLETSASANSVLGSSALTTFSLTTTSEEEETDDIEIWKSWSDSETLEVGEIYYLTKYVAFYLDSAGCLTLAYVEDGESISVSDSASAASISSSDDSDDSVALINDLVLQVSKLDVNLRMATPSNATLESDVSTNGITTYTATTETETETETEIATPSNATPNYEKSTSPFYGNSDIKDIVIEDGITGIGDYLFYNCKNLGPKITIPDSVTYIGDYAFSGDTYSKAPKLTLIKNEATENQEIGEEIFFSGTGAGASAGTVKVYGEIPTSNASDLYIYDSSYILGVYDADDANIDFITAMNELEYAQITSYYTSQYVQAYTGHGRTDGACENLEIDASWQPKVKIPYIEVDETQYLYLTLTLDGLDYVSDTDQAKLNTYSAEIRSSELVWWKTITYKRWFYGNSIIKPEYIISDTVGIGISKGSATTEYVTVKNSESIVISGAMLELEEVTPYCTLLASDSNAYEEISASLDTTASAIYEVTAEYDDGSPLEIEDDLTFTVKQIPTGSDTDLDITFFDSSYKKVTVDYNLVQDDDSYTITFESDELLYFALTGISTEPVSEATLYINYGDIQIGESTRVDNAGNWTHKDKFTGYDKAGERVTGYYEEGTKFTISQLNADTSTPNTISIYSDKDIIVYLDGVNIDCSEDTESKENSAGGTTSLIGESAMYIANRGNTTVVLKDETENTLISGGNRAAIEKASGSNDYDYQQLFIYDSQYQFTEGGEFSGYPSGLGSSEPSNPPIAYIKGTTIKNGSGTEVTIQDGLEDGHLVITCESAYKDISKLSKITEISYPKGEEGIAHEESYDVLKFDTNGNHECGDDCNCGILIAQTKTDYVTSAEYGALGAAIGTHGSTEGTQRGAALELCPDMCNFHILGGIIKATSDTRHNESQQQGGASAIGLGAGVPSYFTCGGGTIQNFNIYGGDIIALHGGCAGAGIGGGFTSSHVTIHIFGGTIEAGRDLSYFVDGIGMTKSASFSRGAGIGGGGGGDVTPAADGATVYISGGNIKAYSEIGAGIGAGGGGVFKTQERNGQDAHVFISGGTIDATSVVGAGIGSSGSNGAGVGGAGYVEISGGDITAKISEEVSRDTTDEGTQTFNGTGAAIGGAAAGTGGSGGTGTVTITGGTIDATAVQGAAIGGGGAEGTEGGTGDDGTDSGYGGDAYVTITGEAHIDVTASSDSSAGIGGGGSIYGAGGHSYITIGVNVASASNAEEAEEAEEENNNINLDVSSVSSCAIGAGSSEDFAGGDAEITIYGGNITAYSEKATDIGAGNSTSKSGGNATIIIDGADLEYIDTIGAGNNIQTKAADAFEDIYDDEIYVGGSANIIIESGVLNLQSIGGGSSIVGNGGNATITVNDGILNIKASIPKAEDGTYIYDEEGAITVIGGTIGGGSSTFADGGEATIKVNGGELTVDMKIGGGNTTYGTGGAATIIVNGGEITANTVGGGRNELAPSEVNGEVYTHDGGAADITINGGILTIWDYMVDERDDGVTGGNIGGGQSLVSGTGGAAKITVNDGYLNVQHKIGGGESDSGDGGKAEIELLGGLVYAQTIGGGKSYSGTGGEAIIRIDTGLVEVSDRDPYDDFAGGNIAGGTSTNGDGGKATITIDGGYLTVENVVGGGATVNGTGGAATVEINYGTVYAGIIGSGLSDTKGYNKEGTTMRFNAGSINAQVTEQPVAGGTYDGTVYDDVEVYMTRISLWDTDSKVVSTITDNVMITSVSIVDGDQDYPKPYPLKDVRLSDAGVYYAWLPVGTTMTNVDTGSIALNPDTGQAEVELNEDGTVAYDENGFISYVYTSEKTYGETMAVVAKSVGILDLNCSANYISINFPYDDRLAYYYTGDNGELVPFGTKYTPGFTTSPTGLVFEFFVEVYDEDLYDLQAYYSNLFKDGTDTEYLMVQLDETSESAGLYKYKVTFSTNTELLFLTTDEDGNKRLSVDLSLVDGTLTQNTLTVNGYALKDEKDTYTDHGSEDDVGFFSDIFLTSAGLPSENTFKVIGDSETDIVARDVTIDYLNIEKDNTLITLRNADIDFYYSDFDNKIKSTSTKNPAISLDNANLTMNGDTGVMLAISTTQEGVPAISGDGTFTYIKNGGFVTITGGKEGNTNVSDNLVDIKCTSFIYENKLGLSGAVIPFDYEPLTGTLIGFNEGEYGEDGVFVGEILKGLNTVYDETAEDHKIHVSTTYQLLPTTVTTAEGSPSIDFDGNLKFSDVTYGENTDLTNAIITRSGTTLDSSSATVNTDGNNDVEIKSSEAYGNLVVLVQFTGEISSNTTDYYKDYSGEENTFAYELLDPVDNSDEEGATTIVDNIKTFYLELSEEDHIKLQEALGTEEYQDSDIEAALNALEISDTFNTDTPTKTASGITYIYVKVTYDMTTENDDGDEVETSITAYSEPYAFEVGTAENEWIVSVVCPSILVGDTLSYNSSPKWGTPEYSFQYYFGGTTSTAAGFYDLPFTFPSDATTNSGAILVVSDSDKKTDDDNAYYCISDVPGKYKIIANVPANVVDSNGNTIDNAVVYEYFVTNNSNSKSITDVSLSSNGTFLSSETKITNATLVDGLVVDDDESAITGIQITEGLLYDSDEKLINGTIPTGVFVIASSSDATGISTTIAVEGLTVKDGVVTSNSVDFALTDLQFADFIVVNASNTVQTDASVNYYAIETISTTFDVLNTAVYTKVSKDFDNLRDEYNDSPQSGVAVSQVYAEWEHFREFTMLFDFQYTNFDNATTDEEKNDSDYDESKTLHFVSYPALPVGTEISWLDLTGQNDYADYDEEFYHHTVTIKDIDSNKDIMAISAEETLTLMGVYDEDVKVDDIDQNPFDISVRTKYQIHIEFPDDLKEEDLKTSYQFMLYKGGTSYLEIDSNAIDQTTEAYKARVIVDSDFTLNVGDSEVATIEVTESKGGDHELETTAEICVNHTNENYVAVTLQDSAGNNIDFPVGARIYMDEGEEPLVLRGGFAVFDYYNTDGSSSEHKFYVENLVDADTYKLELALCTNVEKVAYPLSNQVASDTTEVMVVTAPNYSISAAVNGESETTSEADTRLLEDGDLDGTFTFNVTYTQSNSSETDKYVTVVTQKKDEDGYQTITNWYSDANAIEIVYEKPTDSTDTFYTGTATREVLVPIDLSDGTYRILFQIVDDEGTVYAECPYNMIKR